MHGQRPADATDSWRHLRPAVRARLAAGAGRPAARPHSAIGPVARPREERRGATDPRPRHRPLARRDVKASASDVAPPHSVGGGGEHGPERRPAHPVRRGGSGLHRAAELRAASLHHRPSQTTQA